MILTTTDGQKNLPRYFARTFHIAQKIHAGRLDIVLPDGRRFSAQGPQAGPVAVKGRRRLHFRRGAAPVSATVHERAALGAGAVVTGPSVIEEPDATIVVPPGHRARVEGHGHLVVDTGGGAPP